MNAPPEKRTRPLASKAHPIDSNSTQTIGKPDWNVKPLSLLDAQRIAEGIVGQVGWQGAEALIPCPGAAQHTAKTSETDCKVVCEPIPKLDGTIAPGVYCFHGSCSNECEAASFALRSALGKRRGQSRTPRFHTPPPARLPAPQFDPAKLARIAAKLDGADARWLAARSPIRTDTRTPASFLHALYKQGEKIVVFADFESQGQYLFQCKGPPFDAVELDSFRRGKPHGVWFLTNPVDGTYKPTGKKNRDGSGHLSRRDWQSVTAWRYLVLESDKADAGHWLAALVQMPLRIAAVYTSGGRSIHALVRLDAADKQQWDELRDAMKPVFVILGADGKALSAVRLSRLPCCERVEKNSMQTLLYLNPNPDTTPICELPVITPGWDEWGPADQDGFDGKEVRQ